MLCRFVLSQSPNLLRLSLDEFREQPSPSFPDKIYVGDGETPEPSVENR